MTIDTNNTVKKEFNELHRDLKLYELYKETDPLCQLVADTYNRMYLYDNNHRCVGAVVSYGDNCKIISTEKYISVYELNNVAVVRTFKIEEFPFIVNYFRDYFQFDADIIEEERILKTNELDGLRSRLIYDMNTHYGSKKNKIGKIEDLEDLDKISELIDNLASKVNYNDYMKEYLEITGEYEENFDEYFNCLFLDEVY